MKYSSYVLFFKALSNRVRLSILDSLMSGEKSVSEICSLTGLEQSRASHNLRILSTWGFIKSKRKGKKVIYSLDRKNITPIMEAAATYLDKHEVKLCTCGILKGEKTCKHLRLKNG
ncbi:MAG: metalloregulator ArsR/SmtB family transcription factor [Candidatus Altiarchaeota archaeon]|nr:metalloregulator ArsR/SmtB family transcription factor [Candidatus Altiarchaeota archaeon]